MIAAGHERTADAGRQILAEGGNAVDAAVAAGFASCVAEPTLTGLGAGGFMLVHDTERQILLDFFVATPGIDADPRRTIAPLTPMPVDFGDSVQLFHAGHASVAVPGMVAGLFEAHQRFGTVPVRELVQPAIDLARDGVEQTEQQDYLNGILGNILVLTDVSRELFAPGGRLLRRGDRFYLPDAVGTLELLAEQGAAGFYSGDLAAGLVAEMETGGGAVTAADLAAYRVIERAPVRRTYRGRDVVFNAPPSSGGPLIAYALQLLGGVDVGALGFHTTRHISTLAEVMAETLDVRHSRFDGHLHDDDVLERLLAAEMVEAERARVASRLGNTTHLSVVDAGGMAVSMTSSSGACAGVAVPGTGVLLNNMLGEADLNPAGGAVTPGRRLTSMMSPAMVLRDGRPELVLGSAGSSRIRSAILQVISALLDFGMTVTEAVDAPRVHLDAGLLELEGGIDPGVAAALSATGYQVTPWRSRNLYFGGVQAVGCSADGGLHGHGDPRRGGVALPA